MGYTTLKFPEGSRFLVTGGAGFIGSNLCEAILKLGYKVRCLDDLSTGFQKNVDLFTGNPNYEFMKGDIKDLDTCLAACDGRWGPSCQRRSKSPCRTSLPARD